MMRVPLSSGLLSSTINNTRSVPIAKCLPTAPVPLLPSSDLACCHATAPATSLLFFLRDGYVSVPVQTRGAKAGRAAATSVVGWMNRGAVRGQCLSLKRWKHVERFLHVRSPRQTRAYSNAPENGGKKVTKPPPSPSRARILPRIPIPIPHENIYTVPNILTFSRLISAPAIGYFILTSQHALAVSLFAYAGITDLIDGYIARRYKQQTVVGTVIDPMADKTLMTVGVICLATRGDMPIWLATLILSRDIGLAIAAIYYRWISLPPPKTMARYWDFSLPSAEVHPTTVSKVNTALQLLLVGVSMTGPVLPEAWMSVLLDGFGDGWFGGVGVLKVLQYLVAVTTTWSGASYLYSKDAVKILTKEEIRQRRKVK